MLCSFPQFQFNQAGLHVRSKCALFWQWLWVFPIVLVGSLAFAQNDFDFDFTCENALSSPRPRIAQAKQVADGKIVSWQVLIKHSGRPDGFADVTVDQPLEQIRAGQTPIFIRGNGFNFVRTGLQLGEFEAGRIERIYDREQVSKLKIRYTESALRPLSEIDRQRRLLQQRPIDAYRTRKNEYLQEEDLKQLQQVGESFSDSLVFAILKNTKPMETVNDIELYDSVMGTLSVFFSGNDISVPPLEKRSASQFLPFFMRLHSLEPEELAQIYSELSEQLRRRPGDVPFPDQHAQMFANSAQEAVASPPQEFQFSVPFPRTSKVLGAMLTDKFGADAKIAEFGRFWKHQDFSASGLDYLVLQALMETQHKGVDIIFISVDAATRRLFGSKYLFEDFTQILTKKFYKARREQILAPEYIMFLRVGGEKFNELISRLQANTSDVRTFSD